MPVMIFLALLAQFLSGAAAIVNQTVWQRSLIVYLAGNEAASSMIVVLVFMAGLGAGALWMGRTADRVRNPARTLGQVELILALANLLVLGLLSLDLSGTLQGLQRLTFSLGIPLRLTYGVVSAVTLLGPCFLMGVTAPLMSEVAQRQLERRDNRFLVVLFFVNTLGAFGGGLATGFALMPLLGQKGSLILAIAFNATAGLMILGLSRLPSRTAAAAAEAPASPRGPGTEGRRIHALAFAIGFLALAYEMYLYRVVGLTFEPKPYTFATVLCFYLLSWSVGVLLARWIPWGLAQTLMATAVATLVAPLLAGHPWPAALGARDVLLAAGFWLPCLGFGAAFGQLVVRVAVHWGNDVGLFYGWNTIGSCVGILTGVLVGYHVHPAILLLTISLGYVALAAVALGDESPGRRAVYPVWGLAATLGLWVSVASVQAVVLQQKRTQGARAYFGPEGVVEVLGGRSVFWNGLGQGPLSVGGSHVGEWNWYQAVIPLLAHGTSEARRALVVGLGGGVTVGTLARSSLVESVDVYDINPKLRHLLVDYPDGTLGIGTNPKVRFLWEDGRTGLILSDARYDIIEQTPLYLKQAGSSVLLSREYLQLVRRHLAPGGVFAIYSNAQGHTGQALMVRQTAASVFRYGESFGRGYLLVVSDSPFEFDRASIERVLETAGPGDPVAAEIRRVGVDTVAGWLDRPRLRWDGSPVIITDDHPLVEYPTLADRVVARQGWW